MIGFYQIIIAKFEFSKTLCFNVLIIYTINFHYFQLINLHCSLIYYPCYRTKYLLVNAFTLYPQWSQIPRIVFFFFEWESKTRLFIKIYSETSFYSACLLKSQKKGSRDTLESLLGFPWDFSNRMRNPCFSQMNGPCYFG